MLLHSPTSASWSVRWFSTSGAAVAAVAHDFEHPQPRSPSLSIRAIGSSSSCCVAGSWDRTRESGPSARGPWWKL
jgi:hypothetical protein